MTWLPADSRLRDDLFHLDLWHVMAGLTADEWKEFYDMGNQVHIWRIQLFLFDHIAPRKRSAKTQGEPCVKKQKV